MGFDEFSDVVVTSGGSTDGTSSSSTTTATNFINQNKALIPLAVLSTSTVIIGFLLTKLLSRARKEYEMTQKYVAKGKKVPRTASFTSASMAFGAFPPKAKVVDPIINTVLLFPSIEDCPNVESLLPLVNTILEYERCAGVPTGTEGQNNWTVPPIDDIDAKHLIRVIECKCDTEDSLFHEVIEEHWQDSLREGRQSVELPWWEFLIIQNKGAGNSVVIFRMEHFIGDGLAIVTLFEKFVTHVDGSPVGTLLPQGMKKKFEKKELSLSGKVAMGFKIFKSTLSVLALPSSKYDDNVMFREKLGIGPKLVHSGPRKTLLFHNVPINFIKDLKNAAHVTLNDVVYAALSQALHDYCQKHNDPILNEKGENVQFRSLMPFAFPRPSKETSDPQLALRNKWVFVSSDMGLGCDNVIDRLQYVHKSMNEIKASPTPFCQLKVQSNIPPLLPTSLARQTVFDTFSRHSLVFSNVPGPNYLCQIAGKTAIGVHFLFNNLIPQVNVLTYNGLLFMNMVIDHDAVPDCDDIPILFSKALVDMATHFEVTIPNDVSKHAGL